MSVMLITVMTTMLCFWGLIVHGSSGNSTEDVVVTLFRVCVRCKALKTANLDHERHDGPHWTRRQERWKEDNQIFKNVNWACFLLENVV